VKTPRKTTKAATKGQVGKCPGCGRRDVLGRCTFKGGGVDQISHCRKCCDAPAVLQWKATPAGRKALSASA
jgi:hypothetical protein